MEIKKELLDELMKEYKNPDDLLGESGLLRELTKGLLERAMESEQTFQLGYEKHDKSPLKGTQNRRNGTSRKTVQSKFGEMELKIPRDREGTFEPVIIKRHQRRFDGFDETIISLYTKGLSTREIRDHLEEIYGVDVSPDLISTVTDSVTEEVRQWQQRPLDEFYPFVFMDALRVKMRVDGKVTNRCVYLAIGVNLSGQKEALGLWAADTEGAHFWLNILTELKNRGIQDILIACVDGLKGFEEAIEAVFPLTQTQLCIVHMVRNSLKYAASRDRREVARDLKEIYSAATENEALSNLEKFSAKWNSKYPLITNTWRNNWSKIAVMFQFSPEIRKVIYTTNAIESVNYSLRKITKTRGSFPTEEAAMKLLWLGIIKASKKWTNPIENWGLALNQLAIRFGDRVPIPGASELANTQNS